MPLCPYCHTVVIEDHQFCPECGRRLAIEQAVKGKSRTKLAGIIVGSIIAVVIVVVIATRPPTTSIPQPPAGLAMYNDIASGFAIVYPEDWEMIPKQDIEFALVGFWDRRQGATTNSFYVMKAALPFEMDVEEYFESERGYFPGEYANYTAIQQIP